MLLFCFQQPGTVAPCDSLPVFGRGVWPGGVNHFLPGVRRGFRTSWCVRVFRPQGVDKSCRRTAGLEESSGKGTKTSQMHMKGSRVCMCQIPTGTDLRWDAWVQRELIHSKGTKAEYVWPLAAGSLPYEWGRSRIWEREGDKSKWQRWCQEWEKEKAEGTVLLGGRQPGWKAPGYLGVN